MAFTLFKVTADLKEPSEFCIGVGSTCKDIFTAEQEAERLRNNDRYTNVRIEERRYGA